MLPAMNASAPPLGIRLQATGTRLGSELRNAVEAADLAGRVKPRHIHLCAALGHLAESAAAALGAEPACIKAAGHAAATLSLLTKIDDQVIDHPHHHGGTSTPRPIVRERTRAFLQPTLDSIHTGRPATSEPRCRLAAQLGRDLIALGPHTSRRARLLHEVTTGWATQVDAVAVLSAHPATVDRPTVAAVTTDISSRWLGMVTAVGMLAASATRALTPAEWAGFRLWGAAIQRADALADLDKDLEDGLVSSLPAWELFQTDPTAWSAICRSPQLAYAAVAPLEDRCLAPTSVVHQAQAAHANLGDVPALLSWIHSFLLWRYAHHPRCESPRRALLSHDTGAFEAYFRSARSTGETA